MKLYYLKFKFVSIISYATLSFHHTLNTQSDTSSDNRSPGGKIGWSFSVGYCGTVSSSVDSV